AGVRVQGAVVLDRCPRHRHGIDRAGQALAEWSHGELQRQIRRADGSYRSRNGFTKGSASGASTTSVDSLSGILLGLLHHLQSSRRQTGYFLRRRFFVFPGDALREATVLSTAKSSSVAPAFNFSRSHTGCAPLPAQVFPSLSRYLIATLRPFSELRRLRRS